MCPSQQHGHLVPGKSTFLLLGSTGPHFKGYPTSRFFLLLGSNGSHFKDYPALVRSWVSGRLSQCPSSFGSSCSFKMLLSFNRAHEPTALTVIPSQAMNVPHRTDSKFKHRQMKGRTDRDRTKQEPKAALTWSPGFLIHSFFSQRGQDDNIYSQIKCV